MMMQARKVSLMVLSVGVLAVALGGKGAPAQAWSGTTSYVVVEEPPDSGSTPSTPQYQVVTPTPGTGSVVIEQQPPASGSGPSIPQEQVVIPGPNPAQNTSVGQGQQLSTPGNPVTVYPTPAQ
jgi:hypothetical protein